MPRKKVIKYSFIAIVEIQLIRKIILSIKFFLWGFRKNCISPHGEVYSSPYYGNYVAVKLTSEHNRQLWVRQGFAHAFVVLSETAVFYYKNDNYYAPDYESGLAWDDPDVGIDWPIPETDIKLSEKDKKNQSLKEILDFSYTDYNMKRYKDIISALCNPLRTLWLIFFFNKVLENNWNYEIKYIINNLSLHMINLFRFNKITYKWNTDDTNSTNIH